MPELIPESEVHFSPVSFMDPVGRVFEWQNQYYRGIFKPYISLYQSVLRLPSVVDLMRQGKVIHAEMTDYQMSDFSVVLKHPRIEKVSYCFEWPAIMLKESALLTMDICRQLLPDKLTLQDAYPWNVLFEGTKPVFIDFSSIVQLDERYLWVPYLQFCNFFYFPLLMSSTQMGDISRKLLGDYLDGISIDQVNKILPTFRKLFLPGYFSRVFLPQKLSSLIKHFGKEEALQKLNDKVARSVPQNVRSRFFRVLERDITKIRIQNTYSHWKNYYNETDQQQLQEKLKAFDIVLDRLKPQSVLDIGCNTGEFSMMAARAGAKVVAFDVDETCVSRLYKAAQKDSLPILTLVMDVLNPTPNFGWCGTQFKPAQDRFRSDLVCLFAVMHHLVFTKGQNFDRVILSVKQFQKQHALFEYVDKEDPMSIRLRKRVRFDDSWYTEENFLTALNQHYLSVEKVAQMSRTRSLYLCKN